MNTDTTTIKYFIYARKSSESDERQVQSIEDQELIMKGIAQTSNIKVIDTISEAKSAKEPYKRAAFDELIKRIKRGEAQGILCWKIDRLSRNPVDSGTIQYLLQKGIIQSIKTIDREYRPEDNALILSVESGMANQYIRDLSKNVERGLKSKLAKGWRPSLAPPGYLNTVKEIRGENFIIKDPERFDLVYQAWKLLLSGNYSVSQILDKLNEEWGYRTRVWRKKGGRKMCLSGIYAIFTDVFYTGLFSYNGQIYQGRHDPMITLDEYDRVQVLLGRKGKPRANRHVYAYTGLLRCGECGGLISATFKEKFIKSTKTVKNYTLYYCTNARSKKKLCSQHYTNVDVIEPQIKHAIGKLAILPVFRDWALEIIEEKKNEIIVTRDNIDRSHQKALDDTRKQLDNLTKMRLQEMIDDAEFLKEKKRLKNEETILTAKSVHEQNDTKDWVSLTSQVIEFACYAHSAFSKGSPQIKRSILSALIHLNCTLKDKILNIDKAEWLVPIEKQYPVLESRFKALEPENMLTAQGRKAVFDLFRPELCALVDAIGTEIRKYNKGIYIPNLSKLGECNNPIQTSSDTVQHMNDTRR